MKPFTLFSWTILLLGVAAWAGAIFFWGTVDAKKSERAKRLQELNQLTQQEISSAKMKVLANETADMRATLNSITSTEVLSAVKTIEDVGKPLGLQVRIVSASPAGNVWKNSQLHIIVFSLESDGSYSSLLRLVQMFESLPLLSSVEGVELHAAGDTAKNDPRSPWHLGLRVKLFTTANIGS